MIVAVDKTSGKIVGQVHRDDEGVIIRPWEFKVIRVLTKAGYVKVATVSVSLEEYE